MTRAAVWRAAACMRGSTAGRAGCHPEWANGLAFAGPAATVRPASTAVDKHTPRQLAAGARCSSQSAAAAAVAAGAGSGMERSCSAERRRTRAVHREMSGEANLHSRPFEARRTGVALEEERRERRPRAAGRRTAVHCTKMVPAAAGRWSSRATAGKATRSKAVRSLSEARRKPLRRADHVTADRGSTAPRMVANGRAVSLRTSADLGGLAGELLQHSEGRRQSRPGWRRRDETCVQFAPGTTPTPARYRTLSSVTMVAEHTCLGRAPPGRRPDALLMGSSAARAAGRMTRMMRLEAESKPCPGASTRTTAGPTTT